MPESMLDFFTFGALTDMVALWWAFVPVEIRDAVTDGIYRAEAEEWS